MGDHKRLDVWKRAHSLTVEIYRLTRSFPPEERFGLSIQLRRAAVSVESNISEGTGRGGDRELSRFLRYARGSIKEIECQLLIARDLGLLAADSWQLLDIEAQGISRMLTRLIDVIAKRT